MINNCSAKCNWAANIHGKVISYAIVLLLCLIKHYFQIYEERRSAKKELERALILLNHEATIFFCSFYTPENCEEPLNQLKECLTNTEKILKLTSSCIKKETHELTQEYLDLEKRLISVWLRRLNGEASHYEWSIYPDKEQLNGKTAEIYSLAIASLR